MSGDDCFDRSSELLFTNPVKRQERRHSCALTLLFLLLCYHVTSNCMSTSALVRKRSKLFILYWLFFSPSLFILILFVAVGVKFFIYSSSDTWTSQNSALDTEILWNKRVCYSVPSVFILHFQQCLALQSLEVVTRGCTLPSAWSLWQLGSN